MNIINNIKSFDPVTITALILLIIVVAGIGFLVIKYGTKPYRVKKQKKNLIEYSALQDLVRKGVIQEVTKKDVRLAKRGLVRVNRNFKITKDKNKIEKKVVD